MSRFPPIPDAELNDDQRAMAAVAGHGGPYQAFLRAPRLWQALQATRHYLAGESSLPAMVREAVMLAVARHWQSGGGFAAHVPLARAAGLSCAQIDAIGRGEMPGMAGPETCAALAATTRLLQAHALDDQGFEQAKQALGEAGLVELMALIGFFSTISMILNVSEIKGEFSCPQAGGAYSPAE